MKCAAFHKMIGDRLDGTIRPADRARLDAHLGACAECRELLDDFQRIAESARTLDDQDAPSDDVWNAMLSGVRAARREERRAASRGFRGFAVPRWAYVAGFVLLAAAGLVVGLGPWRGTAVPGLTPEQAATVAKLEESEMHYKLAIQALTEALGAGPSVIGSSAAALFARDLGAVDSAIQACREAVGREPGSVDARVFLLAAYQKKVEILNGVIQVRKQSPSQAGPGASL
jgi:predicted anti-sigma-YlaC factor YlaD